MPQSTSFRDRPVRWLLRAAAMGFLPGALVALMLGRWPRSWADLRDPWISGCIGLVFAVVMWSGFEAAGQWLETEQQGPPERQALAIQLRWLVVYTALLGVCVGAIRLLLGFNLLRNPTAFLLASLIGLLISSVILGQHSLVRAIDAQSALARAEARSQALALQAQLSPHTLFNGLNAIAALIPEDPRGAEEATERLSKLLRRILSALERESWSLGEEFALLEDLLRLEALRFGPRLSASLELPEALAERPVPPLLLLPLVENSLKHGFRPKVGPCRLEVKASGAGVRVADDGAGRAPEAPEGVGLRTVRQRLEHLGGRLRWEEGRPGCAVTVEVPWD